MTPEELAIQIKAMVTESRGEITAEIEAKLKTLSEGNAEKLKELEETAKKQGEAITEMLKKQAVDEMIRQTEIRFTEGNGKESSGKAGKIMSASLGSAALSPTDILDVKEENGKALVYVKVHDKKLDKDFTWQVLMEKDVNGSWTAVKILNLRDYLQERAR